MKWGDPLQVIAEGFSLGRLVGLYSDIIAYMKYLLAVSGGVDSMVLLDRFVESGEDFAVAHFDHGVRKESARDAEFVKQKCAELRVKCFIGKGKLGARASEEKARKARYDFLKSVVSELGGAVVVTAHHKDDLLETIVMNLIRGTGWRGLAPMNSEVERPLIGVWKTEIVAEAMERGLEWVEDETNHAARYFRNRVREVLYRADRKAKRKILELYEKQKGLREGIDGILIQNCERPIRRRIAVDRKWLVGMDARVAREILRHATKGKLTGLQLGRVVEFVRTAQPAKRMIFKDVEVVVMKNTVAVTDLVK